MYCNFQTEKNDNFLPILLQASITDSAQSSPQPRPVVPQVFVPLNASTCMCRSLVQLAALSGHSFVETSCSAISTSSGCSTIRCQLNLLLAIYYIELEVAGCEDALYLRVEDDRFQVLSMFRFADSGVRDIVVDGLPLRVDITLEPSEYALMIAVSF